MIRLLWRVWPHHAIPRQAGDCLVCRRCGSQVTIIAGHPTHIWGGNR